VGTRANVVIRYSENPFYDRPEVIILYRHYDGYPNCLGGAIDTILKAYKRAVHIGKLYSRGNQLEVVAASLVILSEGAFEPASNWNYEQFAKCGHFAGPAYRYEIVLFPEKDQDGDPIVEITVWDHLMIIGTFTPLKRSIKEWRKYNDVTVAWTSMVKEYAIQDINSSIEDVTPEVADSLYFREVNLQILTSVYRTLGRCPCDDCLVRGACIETRQFEDGGRRRRRRKECKVKLDYEAGVKQFLPGLLSYDPELEKLFRKTI
jgi:hypothetical protein